MKKLLATIPVLLLVLAQAFGSEEKPDKKVFGKSEEDSFRDKVVVIEVGEHDLTNTQSFKFLRRTLVRVNEEKAKAVVFELNTPGGYAHLTVQLMMNEMSDLKVPSYAFVNPNAISAGALIAVATDQIYMKPISVIGSAGLISSTGEEIGKIERAKLESAFGSFVGSVVEKKGHNLDVVRAMMFEQERHEFGDIKVVPEGELLSLTASEAIQEFNGKPLLAKGLVNNVDELLEKEGLAGATVVVARMTTFERIAYWVALFAPILIMVGLVGGYLEMKTPGFGIGGIIALAAFALFFFGNFVAGNLAGYELAAIFAIGLILVALDIFLFPGTFVLGIMGACLSVGALLFAMVDRFAWEDLSSPDLPVGVGDFIVMPLVGLALGLIGAVVTVGLLMKWLPDISWLNRYLLPTTIVGDGQTLGTEGAGVRESRVGHTGIATTDLRPSGKAEFSGEFLDVTSESSFVEKGAKLRIVSESGFRILVREIPS